MKYKLLSLPHEKKFVKDPKTGEEIEAKFYYFTDLKQISSENEEDGFFEGYGSVFNVVDSYDDVVLPGAFSKTLNDRLLGDNPPGIPILYQHSWYDVIGKIVEASEDEYGLRIKAQINTNTPLGRDVYSNMKFGAIKGLSIGFFTLRYSMDQERDLRYIQEVKLMEISVVTFPANEMALIDAKENNNKTENRVDLTQLNVETISEVVNKDESAEYTQEQLQELGAKVLALWASHRSSVKNDAKPSKNEDRNVDGHFEDDKAAMANMVKPNEPLKSKKDKELEEIKHSLRKFSNSLRK